MSATKARATSQVCEWCTRFTPATLVGATFTLFGVEPVHRTSNPYIVPRVPYGCARICNPCWRHRVETPHPGGASIRRVAPGSLSATRRSGQ